MDTSHDDDLNAEEFPDVDVDETRAENPRALMLSWQRAHAWNNLLDAAAALRAAQERANSTAAAADMHYWPRSQIAAVLGVSQSTVRRRIEDASRFVGSSQ
jgi:DNA-directed RNA polymerase specialized sigma24 family protein